MILRMLVRVSGVIGLMALVLTMAISVLALPAARSDAAHPIGVETRPQAVSAAPNFTIVLSNVVAAGKLNQPVGLANAGDGSGRLFVLERAGFIRVIKDGTLLGTPYLTINTKVESSNNGEQGLLGLEFDPNFEANGTFYINYTTNAPGFDGDTVVARYQVANPAADVANFLTATHIITIDQPQGNHNGGDLHFSPIDGYLYIGMGDGGNSNDVGPGHAPEGNGQSHGTLLGKMLRLDVRDVPTYTIPATNPFTRTAGYRPEIWALGLRNPWRFSFDRATGDMYIGDVGQNCWEEISYQSASSHGGENYGWRLEEGFRRFNPSTPNNCNMPASTLITTSQPITAYVHPIGSAVTGGYVYRGQQYPWLRGVYFYSDSGSGRIWAIRQVSPGVWSGSEEIDTPYGITAFGEDESGELYVTDYYQGRVFKITSTGGPNLAGSTKQVSSHRAQPNEVLTYTIVLRNSGETFADTVRVTDTVPAGLSYLPGSLTATSGVPDAASAPTLKWSGVMALTPVVTLTFAVSVTTPGTTAIVNRATINPGYDSPFTRTAVIIVNPYASFLPVIVRNN
jgi:uncharacterized repeat protein (TIGR01451 family)